MRDAQPGPTPQELSELNSLNNNSVPLTKGSQSGPNQQELAELNSLNNSSSRVEQGVLNTAKSAVAGTGEGLQNIGKTGINFLNSLGSMESSLPGGLTKSDLTVSLQNPINKALNYNIAQNMNIPNTGFQKFVQGTFKEAPAIATAIATGGASTLPEAAGSIATQAGLGAALNPNNPESGAVTGALMQGAGEIAPAIINKTAAGFVKQSMNRLLPYAKSLYSEAQKGYDVLQGMGKTKLIDPDIPPLSDAFGNVFDPKQAADYLQSVKGQSGANADVLQPAIDKLQPSYQSAVMKNFDPDTMASFNSLPKGAAYNSFQKFSSNPTAQNAGVLYRNLGAARSGNNYDTDQIYTQMRDQLKDNIIMPGVSKFGSASDAEAYGNADLNYKQYKTLFGNDQEMENFAKGNISPVDMNSSRYYNMLKRSKESGAFDQPQGLGASIPMQEFQSLQNKMLNPGLIQKAINYASKPASTVSKYTPLMKSGLLGYEGTQQ